MKNFYLIYGIDRSIIDNELGTEVYSNYILDGYEEFKNLEIDYVTLSEFNIDRNTFIKVLDKYNGKNNNYNAHHYIRYIYIYVLYITQSD